MFSEYASKFLAQSQSRIAGFIQPDQVEHTRTPYSRGRTTNQRGLARPWSQRGVAPNPYQPTASRIQFPFSSTLSAAPEAPLFHSALNEFREEDDEEERERETADFFALQRSRRVYGNSRLDESAETDGSIASADREAVTHEAANADQPVRKHNISGKWTGSVDRISDSVSPPPKTLIEDDEPGGGHPTSQARSIPARMEDVALESTIADSEVPDDLLQEHDRYPVPFQQFKQQGMRELSDGNQVYPTEQYLADARAISRPASVETVPPTLPAVDGEPPRHDQFWGQLYWISLAGMVTTFIMIWLHTEAPTSTPLGDTIYTTLHASYHLLAVDTIASIFAGMLWLALLRQYARPLFYLLLVAVPIILFSFAMYPFIESFHGVENGNTIQSKVMRWLSFLPLVFMFVWIYTAYSGRHAFAKAIGILEFSGKILAANPALLIQGFIALAAVVSWTWMWLLMFTRVFLGGHISGSIFIIDFTTWWLGAFFVMVYLWTIVIFSGIQRCTTAATVSQWYFHRNSVPAQASSTIVRAAFVHSLTTIFGTISFATLLALLVRLPILLLPRRIVGVVSIFAYSFIPTPIATLLNPLSLTYAAIRSQPLSPSARALSQMTFLGPHVPTNSLTPTSFRARNSANPLLPYRLAVTMLHATRFIMSMALGFGGWVATAKQLAIAVPGGTGIKGSAYAYVVGLVAGAIGWAVLGCIEGVLSGITDAAVVCYGVEQTSGAGGYCLEAGYLFGNARELPR